MNIDDMKAGDFVTVFQGCELSDFGHQGDTITKVRYDNSYKGDVLKIVCVELPYVVLLTYEHCLGDGYKITLDTRRWKFMRISNDFIKSKLGALPA